MRTSLSISTARSRADGQHRVERRHRILKDHRDVMAADLTHLGLALLEQVRAFEEHLAGFDLPRRLRDEPHDRERVDRFTRTGFADDP
jgi:hypothetical protein